MTGYIVKLFPVLLILITSSSGWIWNCDENSGHCTRKPNPKTNYDLSQTDYPSIEVCRLLCGNLRALWPQPNGAAHFGNSLVQFDISDITFSANGSKEISEYIHEVETIFVDNLEREEINNCQGGQQVHIMINVRTDAMDLELDTDESYSLTIVSHNYLTFATITAPTVFGARHGLESLSQLVVSYKNNDGTKCLAMLESANIIDHPVYRHRGLMLDVSRNYLPVESILRHIDAMGASKLNVLHLHLTDTQSWPLEIPSLPNMTRYGAYSSNSVYTTEDVEVILQHAFLRGVRVIPEIDGPSHAGNGWQWGPEAGLGNLAVCVNKVKPLCIEPPCGQLNPANDKLYPVLEKLFSDVSGLFPGKMFHMGGDEVWVRCWNETEEIIKYLANKPRTKETFLNLWSDHQRKALAAFDKNKPDASTSIIMWTSDLTEADVIEKYLPKDRYVIQPWVPRENKLPEELEKLGYRLIISTKDAWYLDHGFWGETKYHDWITVYSNKISRSNLVLGGEVCMWGEYVDEGGVESRVWPRAAAAAERLWSDPTTNIKEAITRFFRHRYRLLARGIHAETISPEYCYQNEGAC